MEQITKTENKIYHLAGIVPIAGMSLDYNMPWPDAMMPVAPDYLAVEKAVWECVMAGCSTVWIVCYMGTIPLLRKRIGDNILTPNTLQIGRNDNSVANRVNIYYIPIHPKDRERRDSLGWSVLYGANRAYCLCKMISKWVIPEKFFCSFPYGITDDKFIREHKDILKSKQKVSFSFQGKTVKEGIHTNFTFDAQDYKTARDVIKKHSLETWEGTGRITDHHRKKCLSLKIEQIFKNLDMENRIVLECPWFYDISNWDGYSKFIGCDIGLVRQKDFYIKNKREDI